MTRSIFDPTGGNTERSRSTFTPPAADNNSRMPRDLTDGDVEKEELVPTEEFDAAHAEVNEVAVTEEEAVDRLEQMQADPEAADRDEGKTGING